MGTLLLEVREIFNSAQDGHIVLSRLCEKMINLQEKSEKEEYWDAFIHHVQKSIIYYKPEPTVERVMEFIANFATYSTRLKNQRTDDGKEEKSSLASITPSDESFEGDIMEPFLLACFNFFIKHHNARERGVRLRCCQLVNKLLNLLGEQAVIDEELSDAIYECMMVRLKDKYPPIRIQAVLALFRLQDPSDEDCPVIDAYLNSIEKDIHPVVRKTILTKLAISRKTLPFLIGRVRDVVDTNRKTAYLILSEKVSIRALTIAQRIKLVTDGLKNDRSEHVKKACNQMLKAWFRSCDHNLIKLLEALDTESFPEASEICMEAIFKESTLEKLQEYVKQISALGETPCGQVKLISYSSLTPENVFYWYSLCKHLKTRGEEGELILQQLLPELTNFCEYIRCYAEKFFIDSAILTAFDGAEQSEFVLEHLMNIIGLLDLSDEIGRKNLQTLVHDLLVLESIPISLTKVLVKRYKDVESNEDSFIQSLAETISDIKQPLVQVVSTAMKEKSRMLQLQIARVNVNIQECNDDLEAAIKKQDYQQAALLKDHILELEEQRNDCLATMDECQEQITKRVERDDPETTFKCLTVATAMLSGIVKRGLTPILMTLKDELLFEGVKSEDPYIRNEAVKGLGLLCLLQREFASQHLVLFLQVAQVDQEFVQITAVKVIFDMFLMYGLTAFSDETKSEGDKTEENKTLEEDKTIGDKTIENKTVVEDDADATIVAETPPEKQGDGNENEKDDEETEKNRSAAAAESVLGVLLVFLQSESADLRSTVAEGMAKVMITGRVVSANVLTRLIILWYNPVTEDDTKLRHCLGVFFPAFAFECRKNQELVEQAFLPALKTIMNAPDTSPLCTINLANVIDLFVQLTDVRNLAKFNTTKAREESYQDLYDTYVHDTIAMKLSNEILSDPDDPDIKLLCKALNQLTICPKNTTVINDLKELGKQMLEALENKRVARKFIEKFCLQLEELTIPETGGNQTGIIDVVDEIKLSGSSDNQTSQDEGSDDIFAKHDNTVTPFTRKSGANATSSVLRSALAGSVRRSTRMNRSVGFVSPPPKMQKLSITSIDFEVES